VENIQGTKNPTKIKNITEITITKKYSYDNNNNNNNNNPTFSLEILFSTVRLCDLFSNKEISIPPSSIPERV